MMHTFRRAGDNIHLYFSNTENKSDRMLLTEIIQSVMEQGIEIKDKIQTSDCELFTCRGNGICFAISFSLEGEGCSICVDDENTLAVVEKMFA